MKKYTNIFLASVAAIILMLGGTFRQSASDSLNRSFQGSHNAFLGSIDASFLLLAHDKSALIAAANEESEVSTGDKKDGKDGKDEEDGNLKEIWDSVQLG